MASSSRQGLVEEEDGYNIWLDEESEVVLDYDTNDQTEKDYDDRWCLVGRFLTERSIDFDAMQHLLASLWQPGKGMFVKELDTNRYLFQFYHEIDIKSVIDRSPWTFNKFLLVFTRLKPGENPRLVALNEVDFWVQLHDLRSGFRTATVAKDVANYIGKFVESDEKNFLGLWRDFLRVRVTIDVNKPLKRRMTLRNTAGVEFWTNFKYEHLPIFCFICGIMGHSENFCPRRFDITTESLVKPYGDWMRVKPKRTSHMIGKKWLKQFRVVMEECQTDSDQPSSDHASRTAPVGQLMSYPHPTQAAVMKEKIVGHESSNKEAANRQKGVSTIEVIGELTGTNCGENKDINVEEDCLMVIDSKRRRTEMGSGVISEDTLEGKNKAQVQMDSKNVDLVGSGFQAHLPL
ncbi:hypothetical protein CsatB_007645 [Cannabis sativa]